MNRVPRPRRLLPVLLATAALAVVFAMMADPCPAQSLDELYLSAVETEEFASSTEDYHKAAALYERITTEFIPEENEEIFGCALYSLASILSRRLGSPDRGDPYLKRIVKELPETSWAQKAREILAEKKSAKPIKSGSFSTPGGEFDTSGLGIGATSKGEALIRKNGRLEYHSRDASFTMDLPGEGWEACEGGQGTPLEETLRVIVFLPGSSSKIPPALSVLSYGDGFKRVDAFSDAISGDLGLLEEGTRVASRSEVDLDGTRGIFISLRSPVEGEEIVQEWLLSVSKGSAYAVGSTASAEDFRTIGKEMRRGLMSFRPGR